MRQKLDENAQFKEKASSPAVAGEAPYTPLVLSLMKQMTWEEKLSLVAGDDDPNPLGQAGYLPGIPRLGIPPRRDADGDGLDLHGKAETTAFPSRIGVAATFDRSAALEQGMIEGREGRALGVDLLYGPQLDICRLPNFGRNNTTFGEDPYLSGQMGIAEVNGMQSQGLMAQIKHFAMYNGQAGIPFAARPIIPTLVDDYTFHEIYLATFEATVKEAQPSSVMGSYQMFQVTPQQQTPNWACGNAHALTTVLRDQWRFKGFVLSDYGATHATDEIISGLDQQYMNARPPVLPNFGGTYFGAGLRPYVDPASSSYSLTYTQAMDRAVALALYQYERFGLLACASADGPKEGNLPERPFLDKEAGKAASLRLAEQSAVLLKNANDLLPLKEAEVKQGVAVIGPTGRQLMPSGLNAERSSGFSDRVAISPFQKIQESVPHGTKITCSAGIDWIGETVPPAALPGGLVRTNHKTAETTTDHQINFPESGELEPGTTYTWNGKLKIAQAAVYYFWIQQSYPIPARLYGDLWGNPQTQISIDGTALVMMAPPVPDHTYKEGWVPSGGVNFGASCRLSAGDHDLIVATVVPPTLAGLATFRLTWSNFDQTLAEAVEAARNAKIAIVFADDHGGPAAVDTPTGLNPLGDNQDTLIDAVAKVNENTIVVISSGNLVDMPWFERVAAVLEVWYPGQEGGSAIANLLFGKANPSGRLPLTLPKRWDDTPFAGHPERYLGTDGTVIFSDSIYVGYRWYDHCGIEPMLPFGYGLSYTTFSYTGLQVNPASDGGLDVGFKVQNTGNRPGAAVPQVYVGRPHHPKFDVPYAERSLAQFARIELNPGEEKEVNLHVAPRAFMHWSTGEQEWVRDAGLRTIDVGESSRNLVLKAIIEVKE